MITAFRDLGRDRLGGLFFAAALGGFLLSPLIYAALFAAEGGNAGRGRVVYLDNCIPCHGEEGDGQGPLGVPLGARDFTKGEFKFGSSDEELFTTVSNGISPKMPAWKDILSPRERRDAIAFIRTFSKRNTQAKKK